MSWIAILVLWCQENVPRSLRHVNYHVEFHTDPVKGDIDLTVVLRWTYADRTGRSVEYAYFTMEHGVDGSPPAPVEISDVSVDQRASSLRPVVPGVHYRLDLPAPLFPGHVATIKYRVRYRVDPMGRGLFLGRFFPMLNLAEDHKQNPLLPFATFRVRFQQPPSAAVETTMKRRTGQNEWREDDVPDIALLFGQTPSRSPALTKALMLAGERGLPWLRSRALVLEGQSSARGGVIFVGLNEDPADCLARALLVEYGIQASDSEAMDFAAWFNSGSTSKHARRLSPFQRSIATNGGLMTPFRAILDSLSSSDMRDWAGHACLGRLRPLSVRQWLHELDRVAAAIDLNQVGLRLLSDEPEKLVYEVLWTSAGPGAYVLARDLRDHWSCIPLRQEQGRRTIQVTYPWLSLSVGRGLTERPVPVPDAVVKRYRNANRDHGQLQRWLEEGVLW